MCSVLIEAGFRDGKITFKFVECGKTGALTYTCCMQPTANAFVKHHLETNIDLFYSSWSEAISTKL